MYLKKLEVIGFKSFLNKTVLNFEPGITAVVGPNGCGKSNVFDAIRWVLGEQSVKALRGSEMQDVIFGGTDNKEPLSMAEVTLTFDNSNNFFNVTHDEVAIARRIFRSGESEYLLNKNLVRLKDILDLLMGTGIGAESYSLVAQGKIDLILSSRPEDRRLVFDEASGVSKYKVQKKETLRKLEETEQNLLRVNDIIIEVKRQIGSLERQANKARKYKEVFDELKSKEVNFAILQKISLLHKKDEIIKQLESLKIEETRLLDFIKNQETEINNRQTELKTLENNIMDIKNGLLNLDNLVLRNKEHITFNQERTKELESNKEYLDSQILQLKNMLAQDEEKLNSLREEHGGLRKQIDEKTNILKSKEEELHTLASSIKSSLEKIAENKKDILNLVTKISVHRNEITEFSSKQQIYLARKRRLELEKEKTYEEKKSIEKNLTLINQELENLNKIFEEVNLRISGLKNELGQENLSLSEINAKIEQLEKQKLTLESHKEFIERLKTKYEDINESLNAVVYLDKLPAQKVTGLVVKINSFDEASLKLSGEAKPMDLDTQKLIRMLEKIQGEIEILVTSKLSKESRMQDLNKSIQELQEHLRNHDIALANKKTTQQTILEEFNKIKDEEEVILLELSDVDKEIFALEDKLSGLKIIHVELESQHKQKEELTVSEQNNITSESGRKENVLVTIAQIKAEIDALISRIDSDETTLKILENTYEQDRNSLLNVEKQTKETQDKKESLDLEIKELETKIRDTVSLIENERISLRDNERQYRGVSDSISQIVNKIDSDKKELDELKNMLYELQMQNKDVDFKFLTIKDRILDNYKVDLENTVDVPGDIDEDKLTEQIQRLKERLDSYGTVNLVAIEEHDELKKRYDFLAQQQNDLVSAKEILHETILKISRTTKKMFLETFERVREEFRDYFRLLFNGGDAQLFLIDEQDPLESGIEIICRPPGKKLQNVLLLSGGEKSLAAIALIFAIFKVKPSPFCILDEIDAALDEANVDRYSRLLKEFSSVSQFIVITHNKRTIANADVMYGITMEESGVSKIVSVKFAQNKTEPHKEPETAQIAPA